MGNVSLGRSRVARSSMSLSVGALPHLSSSRCMKRAGRFFGGRSLAVNCLREQRAVACYLLGITVHQFQGAESV